jgi:hypothetical protein
MKEIKQLKKKKKPDMLIQTISIFQWYQLH